MDCIVHGITKSQAQLSNFHFHLGFLKPFFTLEETLEPVYLPTLFYFSVLYSMK